MRTIMIAALLVRRQPIATMAGQRTAPRGPCNGRRRRNWRGAEVADSTNRRLPRGRSPLLPRECAPCRTLCGGPGVACAWHGKCKRGHRPVVAPRRARCKVVRSLPWGTRPLTPTLSTPSRPRGGRRRRPPMSDSSASSPVGWSSGCWPLLQLVLARGSWTWPRARGGWPPKLPRAGHQSWASTSRKR